MKRSVILTDRLGPDILLVLTMKRQVLHRERAHLKVPGCSLVLSALLTKKFPTFLSRLNEISGGFEKILPVSGSFWSNLKLVRMMLLIKLIDSHHYKRHKKIRMTEFHSPSLSILIITQSKASFLVILNYSKMIPRLVESFRNLHLFHSNATKT